MLQLLLKRSQASAKAEDKFYAQKDLASVCCHRINWEATLCDYNPLS